MRALAGFQGLHLNMLTRHASMRNTPEKERIDTVTGAVLGEANAGASGSGASDSRRSHSPATYPNDNAMPVISGEINGTNGSGLGSGVAGNSARSAEQDETSNELNTIKDILESSDRHWRHSMPYIEPKLMHAHGLRAYLDQSIAQGHAKGKMATKAAQRRKKKEKEKRRRRRDRDRYAARKSSIAINVNQDGDRDKERQQEKDDSSSDNCSDDLSSDVDSDEASVVDLSLSVGTRARGQSQCRSASRNADSGMASQSQSLSKSAKIEKNKFGHGSRRIRSAAALENHIIVFGRHAHLWVSSFDYFCFFNNFNVFAHISYFYFHDC